MLGCHKGEKFLDQLGHGQFSSLGTDQCPADGTCSLMSDLIHSSSPGMLCIMRKVHGIWKTTLGLTNLELNSLPQSLCCGLLHGQILTEELEKVSLW